MAEIPVEDIDRATQNVQKVSEWAEGDETNITTMPNGRQVPSPAKVLRDGAQFKPPILWVSGVTVNDALQPYKSPADDVVYAYTGATPFVSNTDPSLDAANWRVLQGAPIGADVNFNSVTTSQDVVSGRDVTATRTISIGAGAGGTSYQLRNDVDSGVDIRTVGSTDETAFTPYVGGAGQFADEFKYDGGWVCEGTLSTLANFRHGHTNNSGAVFVPAVPGAQTRLTFRNGTDTGNEALIRYTHGGGPFQFFGADLDLDRGLTFDNDLIPNTDNFSDLGSATFRMSEIFAANGTINTSDVSMKTFLEDAELFDALLDAVEALGAAKLYQWNSSLAAVESGEKEKARIFIGWGAQEFEQALKQAGGLSSEKVELIRALCKDTVEITETRPVLDSEGNPTFEQVQATGMGKVHKKTYIETEDGKTVEKIEIVDKEIEIVDKILLWQEDGSPDTVDVLVEAAKFDAEGNEVSPAVYEKQQRFILRPSMVDGEQIFEKVVTGTEVRYGLDYLNMLCLRDAMHERRYQRAQNNA